MRRWRYVWPQLLANQGSARLPTSDTPSTRSDYPVHLLLLLLPLLHLHLLLRDYPRGAPAPSPTPALVVTRMTIFARMTRGHDGHLDLLAILIFHLYCYCQ